jgi:hypothetical protein
VNWWYVGFGALLIVIGITLALEGDNYVSRVMGFFLVLNAGMMISFGLNIPAHAGWIKPDEKACAQYVQMEGTWKCVPWEQGG